MRCKKSRNSSSETNSSPHGCFFAIAWSKVFESTDVFFDRTAVRPATSDDAPAGHIDPVAECRFWNSNAAESCLRWHQCCAYGRPNPSTMQLPSVYRRGVTFLRRRNGEFICLNVNVGESAASWCVLAGFDVSESFASCASLENMFPWG